LNKPSTIYQVPLIVPPKEHVPHNVNTNFLNKISSLSFVDKNIYIVGSSRNLTKDDQTDFSTEINNR
jgi:hypothetical protein